MISPANDAPETLAALAFMEHKGYPESAPLGLEVVEGSDGNVWYFYFEVPEGIVELEVDYDGSQWLCSAVGFITYDDRPEGWTPAGFVEQLLHRVDSQGG